MTTLVGKYEMKSWDENEVRALSPPQKCTRVEVAGAFSGVLKGEGQTTYCLAYVTAETGTYTGYTHFLGDMDGQAGSFVLAEQGVFKKSHAKSIWTVLEGSGTGVFEGATGTGGFQTQEGMVVDFELQLNLAS